MAEGDRPHILVTGGAGYVGSEVVEHFLQRGYRVTAADRLMFGGEALLSFWHHPQFRFRYLDIRDHQAVAELLAQERFYAVIHLAAIVGDPACNREPELATQTNWLAAKNLVDRASENGVARFLYASTCSNYGRMEDPESYVTEDSPLAPVSLYARLKVDLERYLLETDFGRSDFIPTALRFATVYGVAPRMRFDLTINEFVKDGIVGRTISLYGPECWRPYCHVSDFPKAFEAVMEAPADKVHQDVFNVGDTSENYTRWMVWEAIQAAVPEARCELVHKEEDTRNYRVSFAKINQRLGFKISRTVPEGIREVRDVVRWGIINDPDRQRYYNIPYNPRSAA